MKKALAKKLFPEERLQRIMELIRESKRVEVDDLGDRFEVSGATIRADLRELEKRRLVQRTHGGALLHDLKPEISSPEPDPDYQERVATHIKRKVAIGQLVAGLIKDDESIMLDDGSTTLQVVRAMKRDLRGTILTNGLNLCYELVKYPALSVFSTGGRLNKDDMSFQGRVAQDVTSRFHASKAILGASGVSLERGVTTPSEEKAELKKVMMQSSSQVIIVADSSKIGYASFIEVCPVDEIDTIVTDDLISPEAGAKLRARGIEVLVASTGD